MKLGFLSIALLLAASGAAAEPTVRVEGSGIGYSFSLELDEALGIRSGSAFILPENAISSVVMTGSLAAMEPFTVQFYDLSAKGGYAIGGMNGDGVGFNGVDIGSNGFVIPGTFIFDDPATFDVMTTIITRLDGQIAAPAPAPAAIALLGLGFALTAFRRRRG